MSQVCGTLSAFPFFFGAGGLLCPSQGQGWVGQLRGWRRGGGGCRKGPRGWESPTPCHHFCVSGRCPHKPSTAVVFLPTFPSSPAGSAGSERAEWYPALLQPLLVAIQGFGCFIRGFGSKVTINHTVGRLSPSVSLLLFSVHDKTMWKGSRQAKGRVRRNKIPYLKHA